MADPLDPMIRTSVAPLNDPDLLKDGDVGDLLQSFRPYLLAIANAELPEELAGKVAASDVAQETLIRGLDGYAGFRGTTTAELARWLRQILQHQIASACRSHGRAKRRGDDAERLQLIARRPRLPSPSEAAMSREERERLEGALLRLSDDQRQAIHLRHRDDLSFRELGERMQRSEEAARKLWARAVMRLQQELGGNVDESPAS